MNYVQFFIRKSNFCKLETSFEHGNNMASSSPRTMLYLIISNILGALVLVCPVIFLDTCVIDGKPLAMADVTAIGLCWQMICKWCVWQMWQMEYHCGRCYGHIVVWVSVVDGIPLWQMLHPLVYVGRCYANDVYDRCYAKYGRCNINVADLIATRTVKESIYIWGKIHPLTRTFTSTICHMCGMRFCLTDQNSNWDKYPYTVTTPPVSYGIASAIYTHNCHQNCGCYISYSGISSATLVYTMLWP